MKHRAILWILLAKRQHPVTGFSLLAGILVILILEFGTVGLAALVSGNLMGAREQGFNSDARSVAEAGIEQIIATWNQPRNRKLLVAGRAMNSWNQVPAGTLQSPCVSTDGLARRPGGTGEPTSEAKNVGDGEFRDLVTGTLNTGDRQFALVSVTYSAGASGASNRRSISVTTTANGGTSQVGSFSGEFSNLINLVDPDGGSGSMLPGTNSGYITLTVRGRARRGGNNISIATVTREFEVIPKCCGASFGSNASTNLGADNRACGLEFGLITGINGGTHFSYYANDRFTTVNNANQVVNVSSVIGIVNSGQTTFDRANWRVSPNSLSVNNAAIGTPSDRTWWLNINCALCGTTNDQLGRSVSGIPIIPGAITLPKIGSEMTAGNFYYTWSSNGWADATIKSDYSATVTAANVLNPNPYMLLQSAGTSYRFVIRTNTPPSPTEVDRKRVEICNAFTAVFTCTSWENVSDDRIADNLDTNDFTGSTGNSNVTPATAAWVGNWVESDATQNASNGKVRKVSNTNFSTTSNRAFALNADGTAATAGQVYIDRGVNLAGFGTPGPKLKYQIKTTSFAASGDTLQVQASKDNFATFDILDTVTGTAANTTAQTRITSNPISAAHISANTVIRFKITSALTAAKNVYIDNVQLAPRGGVNSFCEYTVISPQTATPGFHCVGPQILLGSGGAVVLDTTGGPLSLYYSQSNDIRGSSYANPLMSTGNNASIQHVKCPTLSNSCTTQIPDSEPYADVGVPDRLNFFGRDNGSLAGSPGQQYINIGATGVSGASTGKISRAWIYFPWGNLQLISDGCTDGSTPAGFFGDNSWSINGRIWVSSFRPCGAFHFRIPPSSSVMLSVQFASGFIPDYVLWTGVDWVARSVTGGNIY